MSRQRFTKDTQVKPEQGDIVAVGAMEFADSRIPDFKKKAGKDYVDFGDQNDYPSYLLELYNKSAKHNAIINGKCIYILGSGFESHDEAGKTFLSKANEKQSWNELSKMLCPDIENFGGVYIQVIPRKLGGYNFYHISYNKIRTNEDNTKFYYKKKWENNMQAPEKSYPAFTPGIKETSIYYYKEYRCGKNPYALPAWVAACNWIESDIEVSKATLTKAKTGFSASKFINFYNGEPNETKKKGIEKRLKNVATGSEGETILIGFNNDPNKKPTVDDLGASDLTKEDFTNVDNLITSNIFAAHSVTHPLLFGIQQEGKLGSSQELRVAYDIFKNTYANAKQRALEGIILFFSKVSGVNSEFKLKDVEPIGLDFTEQTLIEVAPRSWILEKLGIDPLKYPDAAVGGKGTAAVNTNMSVNSVLTNLTGKQHQQISRIVRQYGQGKLTRAQAAHQLKSGFAFSDEDVMTYLGDEQQSAQFADQTDENEIALLFEEFGDVRESFEILKSENFLGEEEEEMKFAFKTVTELTDNQKQVLELLQKSPDLTNQQLADTLQMKLDEVETIINTLIAAGSIEAVAKGGSIIRKVLDLAPKKTLPDIQVMYSYEKRPEVPGPVLLKTSRPFCVKMVGLSQTKLFSRSDIQKISERLGYSVFNRAGGFWNNHGEIEYQCRHGWQKHVVIKKK
jgi:hypothetical protein